MATGPICPCVDQGLTNLETILEKGFSQIFSLADALLLKQVWNTFKCNLPIDIEEQISQYITLITNQSSSAVSTVNLLYVVIIFVTLFILFLLNYIAIYMKNDGYTLTFAILTIIIIIAAAVILLLTTANTYSNSATNVTTYLTQIQDILFKIKDAGELGLCCLGGCSTCKCNCDTGCTGCQSGQTCLDCALGQACPKK